MKRNACVSYVEYTIKLSGCVLDCEQLRLELDAWLRERLDPDFQSDIECEIDITTQS